MPASNWYNKVYLNIFNKKFIIKFSNVGVSNLFMINFLTFSINVIFMNNIFSFILHKSYAEIFLGLFFISYVCCAIIYLWAFFIKMKKFMHIDDNLW